ncbi:response regulator [Candidatus Pristimantibacillus sp. PTI5]|uniref:response regulator n=1 Tax=Candidatus Pristimantibacillus sp. PTI5 TaxID=3400422 RepID=UPI003B02B1C9
MKLLIADDQQSLHTFLDKMMNWESLGITEIKHAFDGREAAELAERFLPDLLIIDIQMPHLNGIEALKQLQQLPHKPKAIILSAYDEFEYAREALRLSVSQYLLKPVDTNLLEAAVKELIEETQSEHEKKLEAVLTGLLRQDSLHEEWLTAAQSAFQTLGIHRYSVLTLTGETLNKEALASVFKQLEPSLKSVICQLNKQNYAALLGLSVKEQADHLPLLGERIAAAWQAIQPESHIRIGCSTAGEEPEQLQQLLIQSKHAAANGFYASASNSSYSQSEPQPSEQWTLLHYQQFDKAFEEKFSLVFSQEALKELVDSLFRVFRQLKLDPDKVYSLCVNYLTIAEQLMRRSKRLVAEYETITLDRLRKYGSADKLEEYFHSQISSMIQQSDPAADRTEETISRIKSHVELHYAEDLSLQSVADAFGLDKYQLSRIYKQQFGINYWQYVTQIRMDKAAELLAGTNLKNSAIAEMTGFVDESHFSKTFKKHNGISPKDFRAGKQSPSSM